MGLLAGCTSAKKAYYDSDVQAWSDVTLPSQTPQYTLYLVGDAGEFDDANTQRNYVLESLAQVLEKETKDADVVYLGDNIYPHGLPRKKDADRAEMEAKINMQLAAVENFAGHTFFIPGNHDWSQGHKGGLKAVKRAEEYVEEYFEKSKKVRHYPNDGCGDPEVRKINKDLVLVFIDSQWWLEDWSKEPKINNC